MIGLFLRGPQSPRISKMITRDLLSGLTVGRFMTPDPVTVPPDISLQRFVDDYLYRTHHRIYPVVKDGELVGCVTVRKLKNIPREEWAQRPVAEIAQAVKRPQRSLLTCRP